ncbi:MAG TPA: tetratricopeptide repeat protein [Methanoregulaceae archaeon]|nr:tetratricopeptide repeat protein [Methanoregulaceae archaeon]
MDLADLKRKRDCIEHGDLRDSQGLFQKAIAAYDHALAIDPEDADAWYNKGETLFKMGKTEEAVGCFETATKLYLGE